MSGLLRRIRRPGAAEESRTEAIAPPEPAHGSAPTAPDGEPPATRADGRPLPAGIAPEDLERRTAAGRRGKLRRRARFLRRARELALRDLGGLVYEARRRDQDGGALVEEKVRHLAALDGELRGIESDLGTPRGETVLREPGIGGLCPRCGELHASDARFCSHCGLEFAAVAAEPEATAAGEATTAAEPEATAAEEATTAAEPEATAPEAETPAAVAASSPQTGNGRTTPTAETAVQSTETPDRP
jgi:hypothetical protein